jgi:hypothetical protein
MAIQSLSVAEQILASSKDAFKAEHLNDWKSVYSPAEPRGPIKTLSAADIAERQLNVLYKHHTVFLDTLAGKPCFAQIASLISFMEKSIESALKCEPQTEDNDVYVKERQFFLTRLGNVNPDQSITFPTSMQADVVRHEEPVSDHFANGSSRQAVVNGTAAPTDFCAFYDGTRVNSMAGEFGRSEEPKKRSK